MKTNKSIEGRFLDALAMVRRGACCVAALLTPGAAWAGAEAAGAASTGLNVSNIGRALGMMLFAYLILKWTNRKKDRDDDAPRGFLGLAVKPWVVWLVVIGGLGLLMVRSG